MVRVPWKSVLYIDAKAGDKQALALEKIFRECWGNMGEVLKVKRPRYHLPKRLSGTRPIRDTGIP